MVQVNNIELLTGFGDNRSFVWPERIFCLKLEAESNRSVRGSNKTAFFPRSQSITVFSSPERKTQVSYYDHNLSVVNGGGIVVVNFSYLFFFSRTTGPISTKLGAKQGVKGIQIYSNEGPRSFPRGYNTKEWKYIDGNF